MLENLWATIWLCGLDTNPPSFPKVNYVGCLYRLKERGGWFPIKDAHVQRQPFLEGFPLENSLGNVLSYGMFT